MNTRQVPKKAFFSSTWNICHINSWRAVAVSSNTSDIDYWRQGVCLKSHTLLSTYLFWISSYFVTPEKYVLCSMNAMWRYYIHHVVNVMWPTSISCITLLSFTNPPPGALWDSKVSVLCTLQSLAGSSKSSGYFIPTLLLILWIRTYFICHILVLPTM